MIKVGLIGSRGKMGNQVARLIQAEFSKMVTLAVAIDRGDLIEPLLEVDVIIDFSSVSAVKAVAEMILNMSKSHDKLPAFVIGSTGWSQSDQEILEKLSEKTEVLAAPNFSPGVFITAEILKKFSPLLHQLKYTPALIEVHRQSKVDSPSGTALFFEESMHPFQKSEIQTHSIRAGEVVGDHQVTFYGLGDQITIQHSAQDRSIFARGAIQVALWLNREATQQQPYKKRLLKITDYFESQ